MKKIALALFTVGFYIFLAGTVLFLTNCGRIIETENTKVVSSSEAIQVSNLLATRSGNKLTLNWIPPSDAEAMVAYYIVDILDENDEIKIRKRVEVDEGVVNNLQSTDVYTEEGTFTARISVVSSDTKKMEPGASIYAPKVTTKASPPTKARQPALVNKISLEKAWIELSVQDPADAGTNHDGDKAEIAGHQVYWAESAAGTVSVLNYEGKMEIPEEGVILDNLKESTEYAIFIVSKNSAGLESFSDVITITTMQSDAQSPAPISDLVGSPTSEGGIDLSWQVSSDFGIKADGETADSFKEYRLYWSEGKTADTSGVADLTITVAGVLKFGIPATELKVDTEYTIAIVVENTTGLTSSIVQQTVRTANFSEVPGKVEFVPSTVATSEDKAKIELVWTEPEDKGKEVDGSPASIVSYIVYWLESSSGTLSVTGYDGKLDRGTATTAVITELKQDVEYSIIIVTENSAGLESQSDEQVIRTAVTLATDPTAAQIDDDNIDTTMNTKTEARIGISWTIPETGKNHDGTDAGIEKYQLYWKEGATVSVDDADPRAPITVDSGESVIVGDLEFLTDYSFLLVTENSAGRTTESAVKTVRTGAATVAVDPGEVPDFKVETKPDGSIDLTWGEADNFGRTETGAKDIFGEYQLYWAEGATVETSGPAEVTFSAVTDTSYTIPIDELAGDTEYTVAIVMVNAGGLASPAIEYTVRTADRSTDPQPVENLLADPQEDGSIDLRWDAPGDFGLTSRGTEDGFWIFRLYWAEGSTVDAVGNAKHEISDSESRSYRIAATELKGNTVFTIAVITVNSGGRLSSASKQTVTTANLSTEPAAAVNFDAVAQTDGSVDLSWTAPDDFGLSADGETAGSFREYRLYWAAGSAVDTSGNADHTITVESATSYIITGLLGSTEYEIAIVVVNNEDRESSASTATVTTEGLAEIPPAVENFAATAKTGEIGIDLSWAKPSGYGKKPDGGDDIFKEYRLYWAEGATVDTSGDANHAITTEDETTYSIPALELKGGMEYTVAVVVVSEGGLEGVVSEQTVSTDDLSAVPQPVTNLQATAQADGSVDLDWTVPSNFGKTPEGNDDSFWAYRLYWTAGSTVDAVGAADQDITELPAPSSYTIAAGTLTGNTEYRIAVVAVNTGTKVSSSAELSVTTADLTELPAAVPAFSAVAKPAAIGIDLSWTAASVFGKIATGAADAFAEYRLYWAEGATVDTSGDANQAIAAVETTSYSIAKTELNGATEYTITILVLTTGGQLSEASEQTVTTADLSTAPSAVGSFAAAAQTDGTVDLSWDAPSDFGLSVDGETADSFKEYRLYWAVGAAVDTSGNANHVIATEATTSYSVTGILGDTEYTMAVVVVNNGDKESSESTAAVTTAGLAEVPPAVENFAATAKTGEIGIDLSWAKPSGYGKKPDGSDDIFKEYRLYWAEGATVDTSGDANQIIMTEDATTYSIPVLELEGGKEYTVAVVVVSEGGLEGVVSEQTVSTDDLSTVPQPVTNLQATAQADGSVDLSWTVPSNFGKTPEGNDDSFWGYRLYWAAGSTVDAVGAADQDITELPAPSSYTIAAGTLPGNTEYRIAVVVVNTGTKVSSSAELSVTTADLTELPAAVSAFSAVAKSAAIGIDLSWTAASVFGKIATGAADAFAEYRLYWAEGATVDTSGDANQAIAAVGTTSYNITKTELNGAAEYTVAILVLTTGGQLSEASEQTVTTADLSTAPSAVGSFAAAAQTDGTVDLSWDAPSDFGLSVDGETADSFKEYRLYWAVGAAVDTSGSPNHVIATEATTSYSVTGILGDTEYTMAVVAVNNGGKESSESTAAVTTAGLAEIPPAVENFAATAKTGEIGIDLSWAKPSGYGKKPDGSDDVFKEYRLYWAEGATVDTSGDANHVITTEDETTYSVPVLELEGGKEYTVAVVVVSEGGLEGVVSEQTVSTDDLSTVPQPVTNLQATAQADGSVDLGWTVPSNFGKTPEGNDDSFWAYRLYWAAGSTVNAVGTADQDITELPAPSSYTIAAGTLPGNTEYRIAVVVVNTGTKVSSSAELSVTTADLTELPAAVSAFSAVAKSAAIGIDLSWTAASAFGKIATGAADAFAEYRLYWAEGATVDTSGDANQAIAAVGTTSYSIEKTELNGAAEYTVAILVLTTGGQLSEASEQTVTTADLSTAPSAVGSFAAAAQTDGTVDLSWDAPSDFGLSVDGETADSFKEYRLYWAVGAAVDTSGSPNHVIATEATTSYSVTGILGDTEYTMAVVAVNNGGKESSESTAAVTTAGLAEIPPAVENFAATAKTGEIGIDLSWAKPSGYGKKPDGSDDVFKEYRLYWAEGATVDTSGDANHVITTEDETTYSVPVLELEGGKEYTVAVVVVSEGGLEGVVSEQTVSTDDLSTVPQPVTNLQATAQADGSVDLGWTVPSNFGKTPEGNDDSFWAYRLYWAAGSTVNAVGTADQDITELPAPSSYTIAAGTLPGNTEYRIAVVVVNTGTKVSSSAELSVTTADLTELPAAVSGFSAVAKPAAIGIDLSWTAASVFGKIATGAADAFAEYRLYWAEGATVDTSGDANQAIAAVGTTSYNITKTELNGAAEYTVAILVLTTGGQLSEASEQTVTTADLSTAPSAVGSFAAAAQTDGTVDLSWDAPSDFGLSVDGETADSFKEYRLYWAVGAAVDTSGSPNHVIATEATTSYSVTGILGDTEYTMAVVAVNNGGKESSESTAAVTTAGLAEIPPAVENFAATAKTGEIGIDLSWAKPSGYGKKPDGSDDVFKEYRLYWAEGATVDTSGDANHVITTEDETTYSVPVLELEGGKEYTVAVVVVSEGGLEGVVSEQTVSTDDLSTVPQPITNLQATAQADGSVDLGWTVPSNFGKTPEGNDDSFWAYRLYWAAGSTVNAVGTADQDITELPAPSSYTIAAGTLPGNTEYRIAVVVVNTGTKVSSSAELSVTTADLTELPAAVSGFSAVAKPAAIGIDLSWTAASVFGKIATGAADAFAEYRLYWAEGATVDTSGDANQAIAAVGTTSYSIEKTELNGATEYTVAILVLTTGGQLSEASEQTVTTADLSTAPSAVGSFAAAAQTDGTVDLSWTVPNDFGLSVDGETADSFKEYRLYWAVGAAVDTSGSPNHVIATEATTSYSVTGILGDTEYTMAVVAVNNGGKESSESTAAVTTAGLAEIPPAVAGFTATAKTGEIGIDLSWAQPGSYGKKPDGSDDVFKEYRLYWAEGATVDTSGDANHVITTEETTSYSILGLQGATEYITAILVVSSGDLTSPASEQLVTTADLSTAPGPVSNIQKDATHAEPGELKITWTEGAMGKDVQGTNDVSAEYYLYIAVDGTYADATALIAGETPQITTSSTFTFLELIEGSLYDIAVVAVNSTSVTKKSSAVLVSLYATDFPPGLADIQDPVRELDREFTILFRENIQLATTAEALAAGITVSINGQTAEVVPEASIDQMKVLISLPTVLIGFTVDITIASGIVKDLTGTQNTDLTMEQITVEQQLSGVVRTLAGSESRGHVDDIGSKAQFNTPLGIAIDGDAVYVTDVGSSTIRKIDLTTGVVSTIAGNGSFGKVDGVGTNATFVAPRAIIADGSGSLYIADTGNNLIRKLDLATNTVSTVAGDRLIDEEEGYLDADDGLSARFASPSGLSIGGNGNIYVGDYNNHRVRMIEPGNNFRVSTLTGSDEGHLDGAANVALFHAPMAVSIDGSGNVIIADSSNARIRKLDTGTNMVSTLAGSVPGFLDGEGSSALFGLPSDVVVAGNGDIIIVDNNNHRIRKLDPATNIVSTVAGSDIGYLDKEVAESKFTGPTKIAVDGSGNIYVADGGNGLIRKIFR